MDFNHIKKIKKYVDKIQKFKSLECNKNISKDKFKQQMSIIFPKFHKESPSLFNQIVLNDDLGILNLMFHKLDIIEGEFLKRKSEVEIIQPFIEDAQKFIGNSEIKKNQLHKFFRDNKKKYKTDYREFINKYPVIIDRLVDKDDLDYNPESLLFKQVKFSHEVDIGKVLVKKYIDPVVKT